MATPRSTSPKTPSVHFDIAKASKEFDESERPEPFVVKLTGGETVTLLDPEGLDWLVVETLREAGGLTFLRRVTSEDDGKLLAEERFPAAVMRDLVTAYRDHYDLLDAGN